ncbi:MAG: hypothetical protein V2I33_24230 [Kangiellaceae bacterium]|jgi:hypothetical protein|nr:hypothetical protein [Kangiellaceae bacterium]
MYLSPHIETTKRLLSQTGWYGTQLLLTEEFYGLLPPNGRNCCRRIDTVYLSYILEPFAIYNFDMTDDVVQLEPDAKHKNGWLIQQ